MLIAEDFGDLLAAGVGFAGTGRTPKNTLRVLPPTAQVRQADTGGTGDRRMDATCGGSESAAKLIPHQVEALLVINGVDGTEEVVWSDQE